MIELNIKTNNIEEYKAILEKELSLARAAMNRTEFEGKKINFKEADYDKVFYDDEDIILKGENHYNAWYDSRDELNIGRLILPKDTSEKLYLIPVKLEDIKVGDIYSEDIYNEDVYFLCYNKDEKGIYVVFWENKLEAFSPCYIEFISYKNDTFYKVVKESDLSND